MYKICYNDKIIRLLHIDLNSHLPESDDFYLKVLYPGKSKFLLNYLDKLEKSDQLRQLDILSLSPKKTIQDFSSICKVIKAAGGLVINDNSEVLMIHRRGSWDLPKGKMELGESKKESAIREVKEETGLDKAKILCKLITTYHMYVKKLSKKRVLKPTYWYLMSSNQESLSPQLEEVIDEVCWKKLDGQGLHSLTPIYTNIKDVISSYKSML